MSNARLNRQTPDYEPTFSRALSVPAMRPERVFPELIQRDNTICDNCWRTRWDVYAEDYYGSETGWNRYERWYPLAGRNHPDALPNLRHDGSPRACASCGFESGRDRPLSLEQACGYAWNLCESLAERGVAHDRETLLKVVRQRKRQPEYQSYSESDIYGYAVAEAIRAV